MIKRALPICSVAAALVLGSFAVANAGGGKQPPIDTGAIPDHKVAICHHPGHEGDALITGEGFGCVNGGGIILIVAKKAAEKGHGVEVPE